MQTPSINRPQIPAVPDATPESAEGKPTSLSLWLSGLVFPGAGQLAQKRWLAGLFYGVLSLVCVVEFCVTAYRMVVHNLQVAPDGMKENFTVVPWRLLLFWFLGFLFLYGVGYLDTWLAHRRLMREYHRRKLRQF